MRIAFYAPLKPPDHPTPSGDRLMARQLMRALAAAGHEVELASDLRARLPDPGDEDALARLEAAALAERTRLRALWQAQGAPDLWFCYHPYYKSPDLIGPELAAEFSLPWVSAEASLSSRRTSGVWARTQTTVAQAVCRAGMNFALTARDRSGIAQLAPGARVMALAPFLDLTTLPPAAGLSGNRLAVVAMMRPGDKADSYHALARALPLVKADWTLWVAGDGPAAPAIRAAFASLPPDRLIWCGALSPERVGGLLQDAALLTWPGCGEAYGLAYLEAQAAGVPVVACQIAGVPEVVRHGESGLLVPPDDPAAFAAAITRLLCNPDLRRQMGALARAGVLARHTIAAAAQTLDTGLQLAMEAHT